MEATPLEQRRPLPGEDGYGCYFIGALIGGAASLIGGAMARDDAEDAADRQDEATQASIDVQREQIDEMRRQYDTSRSDLAPYRETGGRALNAMESGVGMDTLGELTRSFTMNDYQQDPGYRFRLHEGEQAIQRAANARGQWTNPATIKELQRYGQGLASEEYGNAYSRFRGQQGDRFNRLASMAGSGQVATNTGAQLGANTASNIGNMSAGIANTMTGGAQAANNLRLAGTNAMVGGLTGGVSSAIDMYNANRLQQPRTAVRPGQYGVLYDD